MNLFMHYAFIFGWPALRGLPVRALRHRHRHALQKQGGGGAGPRPDRGADERGGAQARDKTRIVYCKDSNRRGDHEHVSFTFLGFTFRPRQARNRSGVQFTSFLPAISPEALKAKGADLRALRIHRRTDQSLDELARWLNPIVAGWMGYYGRFHRSALYPLLQRVSTYLRRWAGKKYRRLRTLKRFRRWWYGLLDREPALFAHWRWVRAF